MANIVDKFVFALMLDSKGMKEGANVAEKALGSVKNAFLKTYSLIGGFDLFRNMLHTYTDAAKSVDDFSLVTGQNIYQLQAWQKAIQDTGGDVAGLQGTIRRFTDMQAQLKRYGTASGIEEFLRIGIDPRGKSAFQVLQQVGKVLASVKDNAEAFNIAKNIGIDESTFIMLRRYGENFDKVIKANEKYAFINRAAIAQTREYNRILSSFKTSWLQFSASIMKVALPAIEKILPEIEKITKYLLNETLPTVMEWGSSLINAVQEAGDFWGNVIGEHAKEVNEQKRFDEMRSATFKKAKEAGLTTKDIFEMSKFLAGEKRYDWYSRRANAFIDVKVNANNADGKQIGQEIAQQLKPAAMQLSEQLGGMTQ